MKHEMYAILRNGRIGEDVQKVFLCNVILDEGRMSVERYNKLKRQMWKAVSTAKKGHCWRLETGDGLRDTFGGYPAFTYVRFAKKEVEK